MTLITILKCFGICMLIPCFAFVVTLSLFMFKQIKWDTNLKHYKISALGYVQNPQGFLLTTPKELLEELQGVEERIAK